MKPFYAKRGGALLLLGLVIAAFLFAATWKQYISIQRTGQVAQGISEWEDCLKKRNRNANQEGETEEVEPMSQCAKHLAVLVEMEGMDPPLFWKQFCEHLGSGGTVLEAERVFYVDQEKLHELRHWAEQQELDCVNHMGNLLLGGTGLLFGMISIVTFRLRREMYRAEHPLPGLVPICSWCLKVREPDGEWNRVDGFLQHRLGTRFTHSLCPECLEKEMDRLGGALEEKD